MLHVKLGSQPARSRRSNEADQVHVLGTAENPQQDGNRGQFPDLDFYPRFRYEENDVFPSENQEQFGLTRHYFSLLFQYFHWQFH
jgi:hypothetical protein